MAWQCQRTEGKKVKFGLVIVVLAVASLVLFMAVSEGKPIFGYLSYWVDALFDFVVGLFS